MLIPRPALLPVPLRPQARALAAGLRLILTGLAALVAARLQRNSRTLPHTAPIWSLLHRTIHRFARLMDRLASGHALPAPRYRAAGSPIVQHASPAAPRRKAVPRTPGWLIAAIVNEAACYQSQLETLLAQPGAQAILAASPGILRILAPVRRLLHIPPYIPPPATTLSASGRPILHLSARALRRRPTWLYLPAPLARPAPPAFENAAPAR